MHTSRKDRSIIIDTMTKQDFIHPQTYYHRQGHNIYETIKSKFTTQTHRN